MRLLLLLVATAGCASHATAPALPAPNPSPGHVELVARAAAPLGPVLPVAVAVTSDDSRALRLDARQVYAHAATLDDPRVAALPPAEAARQAGGKQLPGAVKGGAKGVATGGVLGAIGGAISGAIQGGIGSAVARIVDVVLHDQRAILTVCSRMAGVPDCENVTLALPHLVGGDGVMATIPLALDPVEREGLRRSAGVLREALASLSV